MSKLLLGTILVLAATGVRAEAVLSCDEVNQMRDGRSVRAPGVP
jgi:hypothetical protein